MTRSAVRIALCAVPLNALLNRVPMFGLGDWRGMGAAGADLSSFLVSLGTFGTLCAPTATHDPGGSQWPRRFDMRQVLAQGTPLGIATLAEVGVFLGATVVAATLSVSDAAAHALAIRIAGLGYAVHAGLGQGTMVHLSCSGRMGQPCGTAKWGSFAGGGGELRFGGAV